MLAYTITQETKHGIDNASRVIGVERSSNCGQKLLMGMLLRHFAAKESGGQWSSRNDGRKGEGGENEASSHFEGLKKSVIQVTLGSECIGDEANETSSGVLVQ